MGATHLPSTEFDGTGMDDQLEAEAEAQLGAPAEPMVQLLDPDGTLGSDPVFSKYAEKLDPDTLRGFYADMAKIRRFDVEATALQRQGQLALWVPLTGQEAAQIGSGRASQPQDYIFPTYREHGVGPDAERGPGRAAAAVPGRLQRRLEPEGHELPPLHAGPGRPDAARRRVRHGHPAGPETGGRQRRRQRGGGTGRGAERRRHGVLRRRRQLRRATSTNRWCSPPPTRRRWSSSARTTTGPSPCQAPCRPASRSPTAPKATASPASGWTAMT